MQETPLQYLPLHYVLECLYEGLSGRTHGSLMYLFQLSLGSSRVPVDLAQNLQSLTVSVSLCQPPAPHYKL